MKKKKKKDVRYFANPEYILREVVGEHMLVPTGSLSMTSNGIVSLTESGAILYREMEKGRTLSELTHILTERYEVDKKTAARDILEFLETMEKVSAVFIK